MGLEKVKAVGLYQIIEISRMLQCNVSPLIGNGLVASTGSTLRLIVKLFSSPNDLSTSSLRGSCRLLIKWFYSNAAYTHILKSTSRLVTRNTILTWSQN